LASNEVHYETYVRLSKLTDELKRAVWNELKARSPGTAYILAADPIFGEIKDVFGGATEVEIPLSSLGVKVRQILPNDALIEIVRYIEEPGVDDYTKKMQASRGVNSCDASE
tara:strand:- start:8003 stop:8338 length:336 start_codon:yes stop_codon:yes gene_type:complete